MAHICLGISSISEHNALTAVINQFQQKQVYDKTKQADIHERQQCTNVLSSKWDQLRWQGRKLFGYKTLKI